jgi:N-acetylglucosamine repressor
MRKISRRRSGPLPWPHPSERWRRLPVRKIDPDNFRRATRDTPREVNRSILLNLVRERQPVSRADLAREMGVARGTITALVNELIEEGIVREGDTADAPRGRKPTLLHIRSQDWLTVGVDVNRTWTHLQLSDFSGTEIIRDRFRTPDSPEALAAELVDRIQELHSAYGHMGSFEGVGVVVPGVVEGADGRVLNAPTLGWTNVDLLDSLRHALDFPVHLERDAVACALAHIWLPDQTGYDSTDFVYLAVSEGVGTGLVVNGQVVRGRAYAAGEFGHVPLSLGGPSCSCGSRGCWEAYTSDSTTVARYIDGCLAEDPPRPVEEGDGLSVLDVVDFFREGDRAARDALSATGRYLGIGLASVINVLNPGAVIVGGEIAHAWDLIEPLIRHQVVTRVLTEQAAATRIVPEADHEEKRLKGASALILAPFFAAPQIA